jgi:hypothetical protein
MTLVFKLVNIKPDKHRDDAINFLGKSINDIYSRDWFYTFLFDDDVNNKGLNTGLEIYGTLKNIY